MTDVQLALFGVPAARTVLAPVISWTGRTRAGVERSGTLGMAEDVAGFVQARFRGQWRSLVVVRGGVEVGGIVPDGDRPHRRTWWVS